MRVRPSFAGNEGLTLIRFRKNEGLTLISKPAGGPPAGRGRRAECYVSDPEAASRRRATSPEYRRVGESIALPSTPAPPTIVTRARERVTAV